METIEVLPSNRRRGEGNHFKSTPFPEVLGFVRELRDGHAECEVRLATWDELDLVAMSWTVPAERMKAERAHRVPLAPQCMEILDDARQCADGGPYVFPGRRAGEPLSNMVFHMDLQRMKRTDCTPHEFRSSFRVWSAECTNGLREAVRRRWPYSQGPCRGCVTPDRLVRVRRRLMEDLVTVSAQDAQNRARAGQALRMSMLTSMTWF